MKRSKLLNRNRIVTCTFFTLSFLLLVMPLICTVTASTATLYMRAITQTVNGVNGYSLLEVAGGTSTYKNTLKSGDLTAYYGWKIWLVHNDSSTVLLSDTVYTSRSSSESGFQTLNVDISKTKLEYGFDALMLKLYLKLGTDSWTEKATFISELLYMTTLESCTWTFYVYTVRSYEEGVTGASVYWSGPTYITRITNVQYGEANEYDIMLYNLKKGDFVGFVTFPYVNLMGNVFYGILLLVICAPIYLRTRSFAAILLLFIIFGGAGGVFSLLIPAMGLYIAWVFLLLGLAGLFYKVFR